LKLQVQPDLPTRSWHFPHLDLQNEKIISTTINDQDISYFTFIKKKSASIFNTKKKDIWGSNSAVCSHYGLLRCAAMHFGRAAQMFQRKPIGPWW
jgi:hypothetical protein